MLEQSDDDEEIPTLLNLDLCQSSEEQNKLTEREKSNISTEILNEEDLPAVPVTILTGFLGSGKTTLIQYILRSPHHKKKIAVIENEFSGISAAASSDETASNNPLEREQRQQGLSIETLIARDGSDDMNNLTDLIELPNGCICCTVKDSLVETLENLLSKKRELDYIIIECSGMANPGPIASVFWLDDALGSRIRLDGVVTCVDARNLEMQLRETNSSGNHTFITSNNSESNQEHDMVKNDDLGGGDEAAQQIAFADRIIINKVDLLDQKSELVVSVIDRIRQINATAPIRTTTFSQIPDLEWILDAKCFDIDRAKDAEAAFSTITKDADGAITVRQAQGCTEPNCESCARSNKTPGSLVGSSSMIGGKFATFCPPCIAAPVQISPRPVNDHRHTSSIGTVALIEQGSINLKQMHAWLASILWPDQDQDDRVLKAQLTELEKLRKLTTTQLIEQRHRQLHSGKMQIFRIKGIVSVKHPIIDGSVAVDDDDLTNSTDEDGFDRRKYIVQAVNDLWDIHAGSESLDWGSDEKPQVRLCKLVVIGRYLDRSALSSGFTSCLA